MSDSDTRQMIQPILVKTYGSGSMVDALADHLAQQIDDKRWDSRGREHMIMLACWNWFSGGTTADQTAQKIEAVLHSVKAQA